MRRPSGAKAQVYQDAFSARLKSCPDTYRGFAGVFQVRWGFSASLGFFSFAGVFQLRWSFSGSLGFFSFAGVFSSL
jgi:hypothetical protein